jgi:hypothetical protein
VIFKEGNIMYFYIDIAKRKRINHHAKNQDFIQQENEYYKTIEAGEKCLVLTNGTIGKGKRNYNYSKNDAIEMLKKLIKELEK